MIPASSTDFISNLANLDRRFGVRLHHAKNTSATAAFMAIRKAIFDPKKEEIIEQQFQKWTEKSGDAIREWLPRHLKFAEY
jgi:hypothetical protein